MGGGYYSQDVAQRARSTARGAFATSAQPTTPTRVHPALDPMNTVREVCNDTPVVVALDVTRSRGNDTKLMYQKLPMLMGQIELQAYVAGAGISFAAIGDAKSDLAPLQVGQFEADNRLDEVLERFWIEEGGGGTGQESYELCAYYYSRTRCQQQEAGKGGKGYFFFVGDEGFYPEVSRLEVRRIIGDDLAADLPAHEAFRRLQEKFHVFFIYPTKTFEQRKSDIDAEIRSRVKAAGGQYDGVDIRASLIWNNRNDLDLHIVPPSGEEIYYGHKKSTCQGWLDVDMNVQGETTKPVENIRWARGKAQRGRYKVYVQNFAFKFSDAGPTPYRVELEVNGDIRHFDGVISARGETGRSSDQVVFEFDYDPAGRQEEQADKPEKRDGYAQYSDEVILQQWASVLPREQILRIGDPSAIIDVLLGALAISAGARDLPGYLQDMRGRGQTEARIALASEALSGLVEAAKLGSVQGALPPAGGGQRRGRRL